MRRFSLLMLLIAVLALLSAPTWTIMAQEAAPAADPVALEEGAEEAPEPVSNVRFFRELNDSSNATVGQAYRLAHILYAQRVGDMEGSKERRTTAWYRDQLVNAGVIDSRWTGNGERLLSHIGFAYLCIKAADIEGGVMWSLTEMQRYAHREMVDRGLFPKVNPRQYMSGPQALSAYRACRTFVEESQRSVTVVCVVEEATPTLDAPAEGDSEGDSEDGGSDGDSDD